jgi:hypothetical protein
VNNKPALIYALISSFISAFFLNELFQSVIVFLFGAKNIKINFFWLYISSDFTLSENFNSFTKIILYGSSFIFNIFLIEVGQKIVKKLKLGTFRFSIILFLIFNIGYLIFNLFYGALTSIIYPGIDTDWNNLMSHLELNNGSKVVFMFFIILIFIFYLNFTFKRIKQYIDLQY